MNVASQELCEQLRRLSNWVNTDFTWVEIPTWNHKFPKPANQVFYDHICDTEHAKEIAPAYDLGYLMRKLPRHLVIKRRIYHLCILNGNHLDDFWVADYVTIGRLCWLHEADEAKLTEAESIEDATCKLSIELFKRGILKQESGV